MSDKTKRKQQPANFFSYIWNEFLFAREFEYESPLTPDEIADALNTMSDEKYQSWMLSRSDLTYSVTSAQQSDKGGTFQVEIDNSSYGKWWSSRFSLLYAQGQMIVNPDTGMTNIRGATRFSATYYGMIILMVLVNIITQGAQNEILPQIFWSIFIVVFWFSLYRARNQLADRIDTIIMTAKGDQNTSRLKDKYSDFEQDEASGEKEDMPVSDISQVN